MEKMLRVAVVGATGVVGRAILERLHDRSFPARVVRAFASKASLGETVPFGEDEVDVEQLEQIRFEDFDLAFFCAGSTVTKTYAPGAVRMGCVVIDTSEAYRLDERVPLIIPEVNGEALVLHQGIIASPNSITVALLLVLAPLLEVCELRRVVVTALLSASGAGKKGVRELEKQIGDLLNMRDIEVAAFPHQLAFNLLPQTDMFEDNEYTRDEMTLLHETRKILPDADFRLTATCVRIPVFFSHALVVNLETEKPLQAKDARALLVQAMGVQVCDNPGERIYPTVVDCGGEDAVFVGRIREDTSCNNGLNLWIVVDNLRKGSALNAVQIAEELLQRNLVFLENRNAFLE